MSSESKSTSRPIRALHLLKLADALLIWLPLFAAVVLLEGRAALAALLLVPVGALLRVGVNFLELRERLPSSIALRARDSEASVETFEWPLLAEEPFLRRRSRRSLMAFLLFVSVMFLATAATPWNDLTGRHRALVIAAALLVPAVGWLVFPPAPALELSPSGFKVGKEWLSFSGKVSVSFDDVPLWQAISPPPFPFRVKVASGDRPVSFRPYSYVSAEFPSISKTLRPDTARNYQDALRFRMLIQGLLLLANEGNARGWLNAQFPLPGAHEGLDERAREAAQYARRLHPVVAAFLMVVVCLALFAVFLVAAFRLFQ